MNENLITLNEAAKFLKLSTSIVRNMIDTGLFQAVKRGRTLKIDKTEIDEWLTNLSERQEEQLALKRTVCRFADYFPATNIIYGFDAENKYEAIGEMSKFAKELKVVRDHRWLYNVVVAREDLVSTAVGKGVAFLHPRHTHPSKIKEPTILFGVHKEGVDFDAYDNKLVKYFFMLLLHNDKQHLFSLSYLSRFIQSDENVAELEKLTDPNKIHQLITKHALAPTLKGK